MIPNAQLPWPRLGDPNNQMNTRMTAANLSVRSTQGRRIGWLLVSLLALTLSASGAIRVHFYDRLGHSQVAETLTLTIVGPGISKQVCLRLGGDETDGYLTVTLPDGGRYAVLLHTETRFREQGIERVVMSTGEARLILRGAETFEVEADLSSLPGVLRLREKGAIDPTLPPILIDPPERPEPPAPLQPNSTNHANSTIQHSRILRSHPKKLHQLRSNPDTREVLITR